MSRVIYPGPPRTWDPLLVSGTHTIPNIPISLGSLEIPLNKKHLPKIGTCAKGLILGLRVSSA